MSRAEQHTDPGPDVSATLPIALADRAYDVRVAPGALASLGAVARDVAPGSRAMLAFDHNLPAETVAGAADALRGAGYTVAQHMLEATEDRKTLRTLAEILRAAATAGLERADPWIALGGGIVGDVAGFAAACYQRGAPVIQCPTTLLAMVDASVGGKTGVNLVLGEDERDDRRLLKNYVGAFWQPRAVLADVATLRSLAEREMRCGLAECLKHALIASASEPELLAWTTDRIDQFLARDHDALQALVTRNVRLKAQFVESDEREEATSAAGGRALLNLGHTFAHAIEAVPALRLKHGEAVGLGLVAAAAAGEALGRFDGTAGVREAVEAAGLPTTLPASDLGAGRLIEAMAADKKARGGRIRIVVPTGSLAAGGGCAVIEDPGEAALRAGWSAIGAS